MQPTLTTERLLIRPFALEDAAAVRSLAGDFAVADTTLNVPHPYEEGTAVKWISRHADEYKAGQLATFAITLKENGGLIGAIGLTITRRFHRAELGYWIGAPFWNHGYCTEAAIAMIRFGFSTMELHKVSATHLSRNPASGKVMRKAGMMHEGTLKEHALKWGRFEDLEIYGIIAP